MLSNDFLIDWCGVLPCFVMLCVCVSFYVYKQEMSENSCDFSYTFFFPLPLEVNCHPDMHINC